MDVGDENNKMPTNGDQINKDQTTEEERKSAEIKEKRPYVNSVLEKTNIYDMLNITDQKERNKENVIKTYKKMIFKVHPDKNPDPDASKAFAKLDSEYKRYLENTRTYDINMSYSMPGKSTYRAHPSAYSEQDYSNQSEYARSKYESEYDFSSFHSGWSKFKQNYESTYGPTSDNNQHRQEPKYKSEDSRFGGSRPEEQRGHSSTASRNENESTSEGRRGKSGKKFFAKNV